MLLKSKITGCESVASAVEVPPAPANTTSNSTRGTGIWWHGNPFHAGTDFSSVMTIKPQKTPVFINHFGILHKNIQCHRQSPRLTNLSVSVCSDTPGFWVEGTGKGLERLLPSYFTCFVVIALWLGWNRDSKRLLGEMLIALGLKEQKREAWEYR